VQQPCILLAEDDVIIRLMFAKALKSLGCDVVTANHGGEALNLIKSRPFDFIILDWNMPEMDGWQVAEHARKIIGEKIPIVIITANAQAASELPTNVGVINAIYPKPFGKADFSALLQKYKIGAGN
jgi:CheY-like chemotaxis protein